MRVRVLILPFLCVFEDTLLDRRLFARFLLLHHEPLALLTAQIVFWSSERDRRLRTNAAKEKFARLIARLRLFTIRCAEHSQFVF